MAENLVAASGAKHKLPGIGWVTVERGARAPQMGAANSAADRLVIRGETGERT